MFIKFSHDTILSEDQISLDFCRANAQQYIKDLMRIQNFQFGDYPVDVDVGYDRNHRQINYLFKKFIKNQKKATINDLSISYSPYSKI